MPMNAVIQLNRKGREVLEGSRGKPHRKDRGGYEGRQKSFTAENAKDAE